MRNRTNQILLIIVGVCINCLVFLYFVAMFTRYSRLQEDNADGKFGYFQLSSARSPEVLYLNKSRYRIAIASTEYISSIESGRDVNKKGTPTKARVGNGNTTFNENNLIYNESDSKNEADTDVTIDQNSSWESAAKPHRRTRRTCSGKPINDVVLLKTHCTGGSSFANIFYRYGDLNELDFALPKHRSYEYYWPLHFHPSFVDANFLNLSSPNLLINARYSDDTMNLLMKNPFYVTILRNPVGHFESVFSTYHIGTLLGLQNFSDPLKEFLSHPRERILTYLQKEPQLDISLNMVKNGQFLDLGLQHKFYDDMDEVKRRISDLANTIDLVLIMEYFDESLVLLKRKLCWELDDVLHFRLNQPKMESDDVNDEQQTQIKFWNKADAALYDYFNHTLWDKIRRQDSTFYKEVHELQHKVKIIEDECIFSKEMDQDSGEVEVRLRSDIASTNRYLCEKMNMNEEEYISYLKKKIGLKVKEQNQELKRKFQKNG